MEKLFNQECNVNEYSAASLAFLGDCVFEMFVREYLVCKGNTSAAKLHLRAVGMVRCDSQACFVREILPMLTEQELSVYKRGRNHTSSSTPRNASIADYRMATGLETLFGYIYLKGDILRLRELFDKIIAE